MTPRSRFSLRRGPVVAGPRLAPAALPAQPRFGRHALLGALLGSALALPAFAPAAWLAGALHSASGERLLLADTRGTVWQGSGVPVLTGGPGSRDASALPGRLHWRIGLDGLTPALTARHACCIHGELRLHLHPGWGQWRLVLPPDGSAAGAVRVLGQWPSAWLTGLGTPWNTLQPAGLMRLSSPGFSLLLGAGPARLQGQLALDLEQMSSRLSTLDVLGSYRLSLQGPAQAEGPALLQLSTRSGALLLSGSGQWSADAGLRFQGQAQAAPQAEAVLNNLLNIIGRRQGAVSLISIG